MPHNSDILYPKDMLLSNRSKEYFPKKKKGIHGKLNVFALKLVLHKLKTLDIKSPKPLSASLYCKVVELYITMKWKTMYLKYFCHAPTRELDRWQLSCASEWDSIF